MPFQIQVPLMFTRLAIETIPEEYIGVYGILDALGQCIYIGRGNIRERLLAHFNGDNQRILRCKPASFVFETTPLNVIREKVLLNEYDPPANKIIPPIFPPR